MGSQKLCEDIGDPLLGENEQEEEFLSVDEVLQKWAGEFGAAQLLHFVLVSFAWAVEALLTFATVFAERKPLWHCLEQSPICTDSSFCDMDPSLWAWNDKKISTVSEWGLICSNQYKVGLVGSSYFIGAMLGAGIFGRLSDSCLGRKRVITMACTLSVIFTLLTSMAQDYWMYLILRMLTGFSTGGLGITSFVLATEPIGPSKRGFIGMSSFYMFSLGYMALPALAYFAPSWRYLYVFCSIPGMVYLILMLPFVDESPRWFILQGRIDEAMDTLRKIAKRNGKNLPSNVSIRLETTNPCKKIGEEHTDSANLLRHLKALKRMAIVSFIWFAITFVYNSISLNVSNIQFNIYWGAFLNATADLPAYALTAKLLERYGRKTLLAGCLLFSGICCGVATVISFNSDTGSGSGTGKLVCGILTLCGLAGTYNLIYVYSAELFPTAIRNAALGCGKVSGQIGAIIAPLVVALARSYPAAPFVVFSFAAFLAGTLTLALPETKDQPVFETLHGLLQYEQHV